MFVTNARLWDSGAHREERVTEGSVQPTLILIYSLYKYTTELTHCQVWKSTHAKSCFGDIVVLRDNLARRLRSCAREE